MSRAALETFVRRHHRYAHRQLSSLEIHGVLIGATEAVLEEYFHGEHRDKPHDTRSAAKSVTATLLGAAIQRACR